MARDMNVKIPEEVIKIRKDDFPFTRFVKIKSYLSEVCYFPLPFFLSDITSLLSLEDAK